MKCNYVLLNVCEKDKMQFFFYNLSALPCKIFKLINKSKIVAVKQKC